eukprot:gb/GECH01004244.1/.p1 GENE.gb/GECH01004244.1/~~gb/GECH01004244.1/.p1  ORF type:complete len:810 (+),score=211.14 gb/GECH01004244.1/:1-2430(+)
MGQSQSIQTKQFNSSTRPIYAVVQPSAGAVLLVSKSKIESFDIETREKHTLNTISNAAWCAEYNHDMGLLFIGTKQRIDAYDRSSGEWKFALPSEVSKYSDGIMCLLYISPDEIVSGGVDGTVRLWELSSKTQKNLYLPGDQYQNTSPAAVSALAFDERNHHIYVGHINGTIRKYNLASAKLIQEMCSSGNNDTILSIAVVPSWNVLLFSSKDNKFRVWDNESKREAFVYEFKATSILHDTDKDVIFTGDDKGVITVWKFDLNENGEKYLKVICQERLHTKSITSLWFHPQNNVLVSTSEDGICKLWDGVLEIDVDETNPSYQEDKTQEFVLSREHIHDLVQELQTSNTENIPKLQLMEEEKKIYEMVINELEGSDKIRKDTLKEGLADLEKHLEKTHNENLTTFYQTRERIREKYKTYLDLDNLFKEINSTFEEEKRQLDEWYQVQLTKLEDKYYQRRKREEEEAYTVLEKAAYDYYFEKKDYHRRMLSLEESVVDHLRQLLLGSLKYQDFSNRYKLLCPLDQDEQNQDSCNLFKGIDIDEKRFVAVKILPPQIHLNTNICDETIVPVLNVFNDSTENTFIVMELMNENLLSFVKRQENQVVSQKLIAKFMYSLLQALQYLHENGLVHRDLKPSQILLSEDLELKLVHVGIMKLLSGMEKDEEGFIYAAPELFGAGITTESDMWSLGAVFAFLQMTPDERSRPLFYGKEPITVIKRMFQVVGCPSNQDLRDMVEECKMSEEGRSLFEQLTDLPETEKQIHFSLEKRVSQAPPEAHNLMTKLLKFDPKDRISESEALAHSYFEKYLEAE